MKFDVIVTVVCLALVSIFYGCVTAEQKDMIDGLLARVQIDPTPMPDKVFDHGRLIEWWTPQGKRVVSHEDGTFESLHWENEARKAWDGIVCAYTEKFPGAKIGDAKIIGTETKVHNYITAFDPHGTYVDNGEPAKVPDEIQHYVRTDSDYYLEFAYGNQRDAIFSLGGFYVIGGPEGHLNMPAQKRFERPCNGKRTYIR